MIMGIICTVAILASDEGLIREGMPLASDNSYDRSVFYYKTEKYDENKAMNMEMPSKYFKFDTKLNRFSTMEEDTREFGTLLNYGSASIGYCKDVEFFCMDLGIFVAIPKSLDFSNNWKHNEQNCSAVKIEASTPMFDITCRWKDIYQNEASQRVRFSMRYGITEFQSNEVPYLNYKLIGTYGIYNEHQRGR